MSDTPTPREQRAAEDQANLKAAEDELADLTTKREEAATARQKTTAAYREKLKALDKTEADLTAAIHTARAEVRHRRRVCGMPARMEDVPAD